MGEEIPYSLTTDAGEELTFSWGFSGSATAKYPNGDVFQGTFLDGKRHGPGTYTYATTREDGKATIFEGTYDQNQRTGLGKTVFADGSMYTGHFSNGQRHGEGTMIYGNKDVYSGSWTKGKKDGFGYYVFAGSKYFFQGTWKDGTFVSGKWVLSRDKYYEGHFKKSKPSGPAKIVFGDKTKVDSKVCEVLGEYQQEVVPLNHGETDGVPPTETRILWQTIGLQEGNFK